MAKMNGKTIATLITCAILVLGSVGSVLLFGFDAKDTADDAEKAVASLEIDGCKPAQANGADMKLVEYRLNSIDKGMGEFRIEQREMRTENKEAFEAIMEKL